MPSGINWTIMYLCIHRCLSTAIPWVSQLCKYCTMDTILEFMGKHLARIVAIHGNHNHKHMYNDEILIILLFSVLSRVHNIVINLKSYYVTKCLQ